MEEIKLAQIHIPIFYSGAFRRGREETYTNTIQETREMTQEEKNITFISFILVDIVVVIFLIKILTFKVK